MNFSALKDNICPRSLLLSPAELIRVPIILLFYFPLHVRVMTGFQHLLMYSYVVINSLHLLLKVFSSYSVRFHVLYLPHRDNVTIMISPICCIIRSTISLMRYSMLFGTRCSIMDSRGHSMLEFPRHSSIM